MSGPLSERELRAIAYRIADDIETMAHKIFHAKPVTWEAAVDAAIHQIAEREH